MMLLRRAVIESDIIGDTIVNRKRTFACSSFATPVSSFTSFKAEMDPPGVRPGAFPGKVDDLAGGGGLVVGFAAEVGVITVLDGTRFVTSPVTEARGRVAVAADLTDAESGDAVWRAEADAPAAAVRAVAGAAAGLPVGAREARRTGAGFAAPADVAAGFVAVVGVLAAAVGVAGFAAGGEVGPAEDFLSMLAAPDEEGLLVGAETLVVLVTAGGVGFAAPAPNVPELRICA